MGLGCVCKGLNLLSFNFVIFLNGLSKGGNNARSGDLGWWLGPLKLNFLGEPKWVEEDSFCNLLILLARNIVLEGIDKIVWTYELQPKRSITIRSLCKRIDEWSNHLDFLTRLFRNLENLLVCLGGYQRKDSHREDVLEERICTDQVTKEMFNALKRKNWLTSLWYSPPDGA